MSSQQSAVSIQPQTRHVWHRHSCLCALFLLLYCLPSLAQIANVNSAISGNRQTSATTISISAGQTILVGAVTDVSGTVVSTITDTGGDTFSKLVTATNGAIQVTIWGATAGASSSSVTCTASSNSGDIECGVATYTGVSSFGATPTTATGSTANPSVSLTIATGGNWVFGVLGNNTNTAATAGTGNLRKDGHMSNRGSVDEDMVDNTSASASSITTSVTHGAATWAAAAVELVASGGGGGSPPAQCTMSALGAGIC